MSLRLDLQRLEGQELEYKSAASLKRSRIIARAVAAMLNAEGGEVWIGIREEAEVPVEVEGVANSQEERRRLEDALCDTLEPAWSASAGSIEEVKRAGKTVLVVVCKKSATGGPFAVVGSEGRDFVIRVGARVRRMSREEISRAFLKSKSHWPSESVTQVIEDFRGLVTDRIRFANRFWILATPATSVRLPFDDDGFRSELNALLTQPERAGSRRAGFSVVSRFASPRMTSGIALIGDPDDPHWSLSVDTHGTLKYHVPLDVPAFNSPLRRDTALWPFALCELPVSFIRLLDALYELAHVGESIRIFLDIGLVGANGWTLGPYSPDSVGYRTHARTLEVDEILWSDPLEVSRGELHDRDAVAWRAVSRLYRDFGHEVDFFPREWNRETKRLDLSD